MYLTINMENFCLFLYNTPILFFIAKFIDSTLYVLGSVFVSNFFFRCRTIHKSWRYLLSFSVLLICTALPVFITADALKDNWIYIDAVTPFICIFILYFIPKRPKEIFKPLISVFIYNIEPVIVMFIKKLIPWIELENADNDMYFGIDFLIDIIFIMMVLGLFTLLSRSKEKNYFFDKINGAMYALIVLTISVFIASITYIDHYVSNDRISSVYFVLLLNVPTFALTIAYASRMAVKSRLETDTYKVIMEENVKHYESLQEKNDELRMLRHDIPKTIDPILMHLRNGNSEEAEKILESFSNAVKATRPRYITGNYRLDTVLETEAQKAEKSNITIELEYGSVFPKSGIDAADIYTIFPNALDNAIEACERTGLSGVIEIKSKISEGTVYVRISNPCPPGEIKRNAKGLLTTKSDKNLHGFGTRSIKKAAAKYGDDNVRFDNKDGIFTLSFNLRFKEDISG